MPVVIPDKYVVNVLGPVLVGLFLILALPITLIASVVIQTGLFTGSESTCTLRIVDVFRWFRGAPETIAAPLLQVLPALVAAICLASNQTRLTLVGRVVFWIVMYIIVAAFILLLLLNPDSPGQRDNISGGKETLTRFVAAANYSISTALVYFGLLTGLSVKVTKSEG